MILRLTLTDGRPILVNLNRIDTIVRAADDSATVIYTPGNEDNSVWVKEALSEILSVIPSKFIFGKQPMPGEAWS